MPVKRTGSVRAFKRVDGTLYYRALIRLGDGSRPWCDIPPKYNTDEEQARRAAEAIQEREDEDGALLKQKQAREAAEKAEHSTLHGETCTTFFGRLAKAREADGVRDVRKEKTVWGKWIAPHIGARPIAGVTSDEIEAIRDALDVEVRKRMKNGLGHGISGATAENVWSLLRITFKAAKNHRDRSLRVRSDDPSDGHVPPLTTAPREKTFIYPTELHKLLACTDVPREWREVYAIAVYTYVRPEELEALTWNDIDLEAGTVSVSKAVDARSKKPKPLPKTSNAVRSVPIESTLRPLLVLMRERRASDSSPVLPVLRPHSADDRFRAKLLREHLKVAGVLRPRLTMDTATLRQVDFRSCRDSGITWLALGNAKLPVMQRRAGHSDISTTLGYVKLAEDLTGKVGEPFPPLPADLLGASDQVSDQVDGVAANLLIDHILGSAEGGSRKAEDCMIREDSITSPSDEPELSARVPVSVGSRDPVQTAPIECSDAELERAIVCAMLDGHGAVAELLADRLRARKLVAAGIPEISRRRGR